MSPDIELSAPPAAEENADSAPSSSELTLGSFGHLARRVYHVSMFLLLPYVYYYDGTVIADWFSLTAPQLIAILGFLQLVAEAIRLKIGFVCFGCREYERTQPSAQAWGTLGMILVLLTAPKSIGYPILASLGIVDPLIGELKAKGVFGKYVNDGKGFSARARSALACAVTWGIWVVVGVLQDDIAEYWFIVLVGPLTVAAEYPTLKVIDDNAMMELVPLAFFFICQPFFNI